jgi:pyrroline-5-carboxylate reductase
MSERITFIGGGNMASAIIGGLIQQGFARPLIDVVEPTEDARHKLLGSFGIQAQATGGTSFARHRSGSLGDQAANLQGRGTRGASVFCSGAAPECGGWHPHDSMATWLRSERIVRAMPNTPALVGRGIAGLFARSAVSESDRQRVEQVMVTTGQYLWLDAEEQLDAVTALSGSGPAYVFYFMEAMTMAGTEMGLSREQAHQLAVATFVGASELARSAEEPPQVLRQRVTSKGGTTFAAITEMENNDMRAIFIDAIYAARERAKTLGDEFGAA